MAVHSGSLGVRGMRKAALEDPSSHHASSSEEGGLGFISSKGETNENSDILVNKRIGERHVYSLVFTCSEILGSWKHGIVEA